MSDAQHSYVLDRRGCVSHAVLFVTPGDLASLIFARCAVNTVFEKLVDAAVKEISGRYPEYFAHYKVDVPSVDALVRAYRSVDVFCSYSDGAMREAVEAGLRQLTLCGIPLRLNCSSTDSISGLLLASMLDAYAAARGDLTLGLSQASKGIAELLFGRYVLERTEQKVCYAFQNGTARPLLVVSSTGIPVRVWSYLLNDHSQGRRYLLVQSRAGPLVEGGLLQESSLWEDVEDITNVLLEAAIGEFDILSWCNGARVALELARAMPERVRSLVLLSPTFYGSVDPAKYPSPYEQSLPKIHSLLKQNSAKGELILRCLSQVTPSGKLTTFQDDAAGRVEAVLKLPPHSFVEDLFLPLSTFRNFENYMARITSDASYRMDAAVADIRCPILLLVGTHDAAVNIAAARDVLKSNGRDVQQVTVFGAGHHMHLLQYPYLGYVLKRFLAGRHLVETGRVRVARLA